MASSPEKIAELNVKQLEMLQSVVARMAGYGVNFKSYCISVVTAVCGFAVTLNKPSLALVALIPLIVFALIDAQYLRIERRFRALFDQMRLGSFETMPTFGIGLKEAPRKSYWCAFGSWSILSFYLPLCVGVLIVFVGAKHV